MSTSEDNPLIEVATFTTSWSDGLPELIPIRPCPFCPPATPVNLSLLLEENLYTITCNVCNCLGPEDTDPLTAIRKWNGQG